MKKQDIVNAWATMRKENNSIPDDVLDFMKDSAIEKSEMLNWYNKIDYKAMFGNSEKENGSKNNVKIIDELGDPKSSDFNSKKNEFYTECEKLINAWIEEPIQNYSPNKKSDYDGTKPNIFLNDEIAHWEEPKNSNYPRYTIGYSKFSNVESYSLVAQRSEYAQLQFIASKVNVNNQSKTFKEDLLAMSRVLGANFLEEK
jgi:hypothetical protein